jgi:nucleoside-diphosphate-sugar epimerase
MRRYLSFGDGRILRDFLYVEDLIECLLMVAATDRAYGMSLMWVQGTCELLSIWQQK